VPNLAEIQTEVKLAWEKEALGLYLSGHPLAEKADLLRQVVTAWSNELAEILPDTPVVMGGIASNWKEINHRKGEPMAFLTVERYDREFRSSGISAYFCRQSVAAA